MLVNVLRQSHTGCFLSQFSIYWLTLAQGCNLGCSLPYSSWFVCPLNPTLNTVCGVSSIWQTVDWFHTSGSIGSSARRLPSQYCCSIQSIPSQYCKCKLTTQSADLALNFILFCISHLDHIFRFQTFHITCKIQREKIAVIKEFPCMKHLCALLVFV